MTLQMHNAHTVALGSTVCILDLESHDREIYTLVRPSDADIRRNHISTLTPIGKALYGRRSGDIVEVDAPGGLFRVEIEAIRQANTSSYARDG